MDCLHKLQRLNRAIEDQKRYISRVPDPDNRCLAEVNLATMVELRDKLENQVGELATPHGGAVDGAAVSLAAVTLH